MPRLRPLLLLVAALTFVGCSSAPDEGPSLDDRIAAVAQARATVGPVAGELAGAVTAVGQRVLEVHTEGVGVEDRLERIETIRSVMLADLADAVAESRSVELAATTREVAAITTAWDAMRDQAAETIAHAQVDLAHLQALLDAEVALLAIAEVWQSPGSRSEQIEALEAAAVQAEAVEADLARLTPAVTCARATAHRIAAARHVADASRELRELVSAQRGRDFDSRRAELGQDPLGTGASMVDLDADDLPCWEEALPTSVAVSLALAAAERLEQALNPAGLARQD